MVNTNTLDAYDAGMRLAFKQFGFTKSAIDWKALKQNVWGVGPTEALKQFRNKTLTAPGGALHNWWKPQGGLDLAFNYALPAYNMYRAMSNKNDPDRLNTALGLGGSTAGMILGSRLWGIPGSMIGGTLGQMAGRAAGKLLSPLTQPKAQLPDPMLQQVNYGY
jgi:hypothetical protein